MSQAAHPRVELHHEGGLFIAVCHFVDKDIPKDAGFRWNPTTKRWETRQLRTALCLAEYATPEARNAIRERMDDDERAKLDSAAKDSDMAIPAPEGCEYMPFQRAGIAYGMARPSVLLADEPGLGKTIQAIGIINADPSIQRVMVVCPASLRINWKREMDKWLVRPLRVRVAESGWPIGSEVIICNYDRLEKFQPELKHQYFDLLILDEAHYIKTRKAKRSKMAKAIYARRKVLITGTPIVNRPVELWNLIECMGGLGMKFWEYVNRYCNAYKSRFGWDFSGSCHLDELQEQLRIRYMVRRLKKDVLAELPVKTWQIIELPANGLSGQVQRECEFMERKETTEQALKEARDQAKDAGDEASYRKAVDELSDFAKSSFAEMSLIRHETARMKVPYVIEHAKEILEESEKLVVFAHHHDVVASLAAGLRPYGAVVLSGETSLPNRQAAVDAFQTDPKVRVFIGSIQAAGVGLTLTAASRCVFAELDWTPSSLSQAEDRLHRIGQRDAVQIQHIVVEGSIDAHIAKIVVEKQRVIGKALNAEEHGGEG